MITPYKIIILPLNEVRPKRSCWRGGAARPKSAAVRRWICRQRRRVRWTTGLLNRGNVGKNRGKTLENRGKTGEKLGKSGYGKTEDKRWESTEKHGGELRLGKAFGRDWKNREKTHTHTLVTGECRKSECVK